ncbi:MAG: heparin lyase I family protein, partial [Bacteroidota bacterium]|nr:heparin lyase I family protein [Bacteroidota bacterium]
MGQAVFFTIFGFEIIDCSAPDGKISSKDQPNNLYIICSNQEPDAVIKQIVLMFKLVNIHLLILLLCFFSITNRICGQASPRQNMILESTFEGPGFLSGWYNNQHCCDYSIQQSSEKVKAGSSALRIEVRSTDEVISNSIRAELVTDSDPLNQDRWYGFSMYLLDWVDDDAP